jgi:hypothetical protein
MAAVPHKVLFARLFGKFHFVSATPGTGRSLGTVICEHYDAEEKKANKFLACDKQNYAFLLCRVLLLSSIG